MLYEVMIEVESSPVFANLNPLREKIIWQQDDALPHYGNNCKGVPKR